MVSRSDVVKNLEYLTPRLYWVCEKIYPEKKKSKQLLGECLSVLAIQTKGSSLGGNFEGALVVSSYLFKKSLETLSNLLKRRVFQVDKQNPPFYQLSPFARFLLLLKYRMEFQDEEILRIAHLEGEDFEDELFKAQEFLEKASSPEVRALL